MNTLEHALNMMEKDLQKGFMSPEAEIYAVNNLQKKSDIKKFRNEYIKKLTKVIEQKVEQDKKPNHVTNLVKRGYTPDKVARFFVHDGLLFTLGHIYNSQVLNRWYSTLPYMKKGFPNSKDMYKK